jgi:hypothetical protein
MKLLVTGDRDWTDRQMIFEVLQELVSGLEEQVTVIHGDADGVDKIAGWAVVELGLVEDPHPAQWYREDLQGAKHFFRGADHERNLEMLNEDPDLVIAFHDSLLQSKGTRHCVLNALKRGKKVSWFLHDPENFRKYRRIDLESSPERKSEQILKDLVSTLDWM